jgi:hypothetical protein
MKQLTNMQKLEEILRSSSLVAGGFMGTDHRSLSEIINSDMSELAELKITTEKIVNRMNAITNAAIPALGCWIQVDKKLEAKVEEAKGLLSCPWPHPARFAKRVTYVKNLQSGQSIKWADLNIHLIESHNFFEGKGSPFRIEPKELIKIIF